jgi:transposase
MTSDEQTQDLNSLPQWARKFIHQLITRNQELESQVRKLESRVRELEAQIAKNSSNSGKPPSSDGLKKPPKTTSQRGKSGRKPGGQNGHQGRTLEQVDKPDFVVTHSPVACGGCGHSLAEVEGASIGKRQVFDLPEPKIEVTEHRIEAKICPCCGGIAKGVFPENVTAPVQYGERVQALAAYFAHQHFLPFDRLSQMFEDVFGIGISPATCANVDRRLFAKLESFESNLKAHLVASQVLHFDETGIRCNKKLHWIHVASSEAATFYGIHAKRGRQAIDDFDVLPQFHGNAIHDHWFPYFAYEQVTHGLCNSHHLRELTFVHEHEKEDWAKEMKGLLLKAKKIVEDHAEQGLLSEEHIKALEAEYAAIILKGMNYHLALPPLASKKKGKRKQRVGKNLLDRLADYYKCVLRFVYDFYVPFTNNQGEQDIRMVKLKQKISGCFRKLEGGQIFCRIRSYISTSRKQDWGVWDALTDALRGNPRVLPVGPSG